MRMLLDGRMGAGERAYRAVEVDEGGVAIGFGVIKDTLDTRLFCGIVDGGFV